MNAPFVPDREPDRWRPRPSPELDPVDELKRIVSAKWQLFRIQFLCAAPAGLSVLNEVEIRATDVSVAIVSAARVTFPPKTVAVRILDHESQVVFERHRVKSYSSGTRQTADRWSPGTATSAPAPLRIDLTNTPKDFLGKLNRPNGSSARGGPPLAVQAV